MIPALENNLSVSVEHVLAAKPLAAILVRILYYIY
jgi:hypothetical protein